LKEIVDDALGIAKYYKGVKAGRSADIPHDLPANRRNFRSTRADLLQPWCSTRSTPRKAARSMISAYEAEGQLIATVQITATASTRSIATGFCSARTSRPRSMAPASASSYDEETRRGPRRHGANCESRPRRHDVSTGVSHVAHQKAQGRLSLGFAIALS